MKHILASTTRQWNCGDEFILFGVQNLIDSAEWIIFNRNPDIKGKKSAWDNSWRGQSLNSFDHIIVAGSPEWFGNPLSLLFNKAKNERKDIKFLGIGYPHPNVPLKKIDIDTLKRSKMIVCRDKNASFSLNKHNITNKIMPCPAFFASKTAEIRRNKKIAGVIQNDKIANQKISTKLKKQCINIFDKLNCDVITHYVDEYIFSRKHFKNVRYSYESRDYLNIYNDYDLVISTRLHGAIIAMSMGIPAILVSQGGSHGGRLSGAGKMFPFLEHCSPEQIEKVVNKKDIKKCSEQILKFKDLQKKLYKRILDAYI